MGTHGQSFGRFLRRVARTDRGAANALRWGPRGKNQCASVYLDRIATDLEQRKIDAETADHRRAEIVRLREDYGAALPVVQEPDLARHIPLGCGAYQTARVGAAGDFVRSARNQGLTMARVAG